MRCASAATAPPLQPMTASALALAKWIRNIREPPSRRVGPAGSSGKRISASPTGRARPPDVWLAIRRKRKQTAARRRQFRGDFVRGKVDYLIVPATILLGGRLALRPPHNRTGPAPARSGLSDG